MLDASHLDWSTPAILGEPDKLARLRVLGVIVGQTGASWLDLWSWVHSTGSQVDVATAIKSAARGRHDEDGWNAVAPALRDQVRVPQRDALIAANLAADATLASVDELSEHLLIDVATSPCMKTSRIKQAITSVQLFIHRTFLRLEAEDVQLDEHAGDLWVWMKNYRVWEANRKVFLYPENWIAPGLRGDKTPQFEAFESALLQDRLDDRQVERALSGYLEALDEVSNLEIVSVWSEGAPAKDVWVLGRSQAAPHKYYLRQRGDWNRWRPWEEVPVEIEGDNVVLLRNNSRLFLFWVMFHDASSSPNQEGSEFDAKQLSIAWSERTHEGWTRIKVSERTRPQSQVGMYPNRFRLHFWDRDDRIHMTVFRMAGNKYGKAGEVYPAASFTYDAVAQSVSCWTGTTSRLAATPISRRTAT